jgi:hypothetical protein
MKFREIVQETILKEEVVEILILIQKILITREKAAMPIITIIIIVKITILILTTIKKIIIHVKDMTHAMNVHIKKDTLAEGLHIPPHLLLENHPLNHLLLLLINIVLIRLEISIKLNIILKDPLENIILVLLEKNIIQIIQKTLLKKLHRISIGLDLEG